LFAIRRAPDSNPIDAGSLWHRRLANLNFLGFFRDFSSGLSVLGSVSRLIHWAIVEMARRQRLSSSSNSAPKDKESTNAKDQPNRRHARR
jgi:hypothetical protein